MRQWDTKKQFKPRYGYVAKVVFLGVWIALSEQYWWGAFCALWDAVVRLSKMIGNVLLGVILLITSPVMFPIFLLTEVGRAKRQRLAYLRRNRAADEDI
jgi:hypothetical protein